MSDTGVARARIQLRLDVTLRTPADVGCCAHEMTAPGQAEALSLAAAFRLNSGSEGPPV